MDNLTPALDVSRSVFIQACAGAGKTFALTKRYAAILDSFAQKIEQGKDHRKFDHKQILVITFTKKATAEMNRRIYKDVNILLSGNKPEGMEKRDFCPTLRTSKHDQVRYFTQNLKDTFSRNSISTIDSFCANILREFAYKLDLDPQFLSQDEHDTKKLLNETLDIWITKKLKEDPEYFNTLLEDLSFYQIKETLKDMYGAREVLDDYINDFEAKPEDEIWKDWLARYTPSGEIENLVPTFKAMWKIAQPLCIEKNDALYKGLSDLYQNMNNLDQSNPLEYRAFLISDVFRNSIFVTKAGTYVKNKGSKNNWKDNKETVEGWFQLLKDTVAEEYLLMTPGRQDKKIIPLLKSLIKSYRDFNDYFYRIRMERDLLDFSDVIILTHKLLRDNEDVRNILGKRYRHIMLDEFQDTNPLRWNIIKMIMDAGKDIKLFIVGDRKQSIYRFNNADVTVMNTAQDAVSALDGDPIEFNDNYRSSQKFIDEAINPLMREVLKDPVEDYEAGFEDTHSPKKKIGINEPTIERIWCEVEHDNEEYIPAYHTAYQVKRLLEKFENSEIDEKPNEPLIGVLLRRGTKLGEYLQAFYKFNIPVDIVGGKDFYKSQALQDIFHLISVLDNPLDDHALVGLLRSPFFALPDPLIHKLADRHGKSVYAAMSSVPELRNAYHELLIWRERSKTIPLDELIAGIIDEEDRELAYVSELMPEQQLANFDKALNIIRGLQRNGSSLREIREFLYYQIKTGADESQADYPAMARVQILTVHKAKGLEFPIVVIPEMNSKGNSSKEKFRYGKHGHHSEITLSLGNDEKPGMLTRLKEITKNEEEAEDKRVFYVAVTRAIHKVLLLGEGEKSGANSWWTKYVLGHLDSPDQKDLLVENWPVNIDLVQKENILPSKENKSIKKLEWNEKQIFEEPGKYLYRTPHDLMGMDDESNFSFSNTGLGTAPGNIFHFCMEKGWLDYHERKDEIKAHISDHYSDLPEKELIARIKPWLDNIKDHEIAKIILDPDIEKFTEHKVKGWLGNDRDIVQVNGSIDLLYKTIGQWVILDYKTDTTKQLLPYYKLQLQSYQWMLKQTYGIEAQAKIYFVSLDEIEEIAWHENYFKEITLELDVHVKLPKVSIDLGQLIPELKAGKHLILCASAQHEEQLYLALAKEGLLRPDIKIRTLNKFLHEGKPELMSQDMLRLLIRHKNTNMKNGTADLLAKALRDEELKKGRIKNEFRDKYKDLTRSDSYRSAAEPYLKARADGYRIIMLDVYAETELEKTLTERLASESELVKLSLSPNCVVEKYKLIQAYSPREEVLACAKHIKENCRADEEIVIAVASMEKYAPHLQRQLPKLGLRARFIGPRSLYELPCTILLMNYLKLCSKGDPDWTELASVNLNALMHPEDQLYDHDKDFRQHPINEISLPQTDLRLCRESSALLEYVTKLTDDLKKDKNGDTCKACDKFLEVLEKVIKDLTLIDAKVDINSIYREMSERIKKESIPRRDQWNGIPVVGLLDSLGMQADKLYVLGMVEGDIPRQEGDNPFFTKNRDYTLELNKHFMDEWKKLGEKVIFCTSTHAEDGSEQNRSSFLENTKTEIMKEKPVTRRKELLNYAGNRISGHDSTLVERHHEILEQERGQFSGDVDFKQNEFNVSVTQVDKLLACPMKFYFETLMKCYPMDQEDMLFWAGKRGNVIHKAFEYFIEDHGYQLELTSALELMSKCLDKALDAESIDKNDALQMDQFRHYVKGLSEASDKNCLAKNLAIIKEKYNDFDKINSEIDFKDLNLGHPELEILLNGRIDKIMTNEEEKKLIASDFKTGTVTTSLLSKMMLSQLYLYLKYCALTFPGYELKAMYEKLKKPDDCRMIEYMESGDEFKQLGNNSKQSFVIEEFEKHLNELFSQIAAGKYYITEKDFNAACKNCPHESLCRKNTRIRS